jgi:hypothetical protein
MSGLRQRLVGGAGAQAYAQVVQLLVRLGEVPLFLAIWTAPTYGKWLVLAAIPGFLTFADGGFATTSARDLMIRLAAGDLAGARAVATEAGLEVWADIALPLTHTGPVTFDLGPMARWLEFKEPTP